LWDKHSKLRLLKTIAVSNIKYSERLKRVCNTRFPLLRFHSALHCGYSGITDIQDGLFFVLTHARTFKKLGSGAR
jgi:hypothetical protein